ncbi:MAG: hypothetical protein RhofKO_17840 [Rhodothermales bacterium]
MPEEVAVIALVAIISGTLMVLAIARMISKTIAAKNEQKYGSQSTGSSLTQGELEKMLGRVVANAQEPLVERLDMIEMMLLKQPALVQGQTEEILALHEPEDEHEAMTARKRTSA